MAKNQKIFKFGKIRKNEETEHFEKKTLSTFKKIFIPKWEGGTENMLVVAGRLVHNTLKVPNAHDDPFPCIYWKIERLSDLPF